MCSFTFRSNTPVPDELLHLLPDDSRFIPVRNNYLLECKKNPFCQQIERLNYNPNKMRKESKKKKASIVLGRVVP